MKLISLTKTLSCAIALGLLANTSAFADDCTPKHKFTTIEPGTLTVAVVSVDPIITLVNGELGGFEGMILNQFAAEECLKVRGVEIGGPGIIPSVQAKRVDLATGGWYRTKARTEIIDMSYPTMISRMAIIAKGSIGSYAEIKDKNVGTPQGNLWVNDTQEYYGDAIRIYQSFDQVYNDLRTGRLDAGIVPYELGLKWGETLDGFKTSTPAGIPEIHMSIDEPQVGFPLAKGNPDFVIALDASIKTMHESGFIKKALQANGLPEELEAKGAPRFIE